MGVSKRYFYETIGVSRGTLESSTGITEDVVAKFIAKYPEINPEWLLTGKGEMLLSGETKKGKKDCVILPLVPIEAMAGYNGQDFPGIRIEDCVLYEVPDFVSLGAQFVIRVSGSSMTPAYASGDLLACRMITDVTFFQWGKVYVMDTNQGAMVKRLFPGKDDEHIRCCSDNEQFPPFEITKEDIRSLSIVVGSIRLE